MITRFLFVLLAGGLVLCSSCDEAEPVPGFLDIPDFRIEVSANSDGSASSNIPEVWVFIDGAFLGVYDLPARVPVVETGTIEVRVEAGIHENGIGEFPDIYPFYAPWTTTVDLLPGESVTLQPVAGYVADAEFAFIEDFEGSDGIIFNQNLLGDQELVRTATDVFEGSFSGEVVFAAEEGFAEIFTGPRFADLLNLTSFAVYLEVDYKSDVPVVWGILGDDDPIAGPDRLFNPGFRATDEWQKIYFNFGQLIADANFDNYAIGFQAIVPDDYTGPATVTVRLDNIKLVHF